MPNRITKLASDRFFRLVKFKGGCWLWAGAKDYYGRGRFHYEGHLLVAPRFSYEYFVEPLKNGYFALHKEICGTPSCVKPSHLYAGTTSDNMRDARDWGGLKGREFFGGKSAAGRKGVQHGRAKLVEADVLEIRRLHAEDGLGYKRISRLYPVSSVQIYYICSRRSWSHI